MRIYLGVLTALSVLTACTKGTVPDPPPPVNPPGQVTSITITQPQTDNMSIIILRYDSVNNLISASNKNVNFMSSSSPAVDSGTNYFLVDAATNLPSGYIEDYRKYFYTEDYISEHILYYDPQQRVIKDSVIEILNGPGDYKTVDYYTYSDNAIKVERAYNGTTDITLLDSILLEDGNVSGKSEYGVNNGVLGLSYRWTGIHAYAGIANPFYNKRTADAVGAFYFMNGVGDFLSKDIVQFFPEEITWTKDSKGRVVSGIGAAGTTVQYTYQP